MAQADVRIDGHKVLGTYSTDDEMNYVNDDRNRRFYLNPGREFNFDYGKGFQSYTDWHEFKEGVFAWMRNHRQVLIDNGILDTDRSRLNLDFVVGRALLSELLQLGGNKDLCSGVAVTLHRGTYYIRDASSFLRHKKTVEDKLDVDSRMRAASSKLLFRFLTSRDGLTPDEPAPFDDNEAFFSVMSVNCGRHRILVRGEMQAEKRVNADDPPPALPKPMNCLNVRSREQHKIIPPMRALAWWAPNVIAGIPKIVVGLRDDERRIIHRVEYLDTDRLTTTRYAQDRWEPGACIRTLESLLSQIKELVPDDDPDSFKHIILEVRPVPGGPEVEHRMRNRKFELLAWLEEQKDMEERIRNVLDSKE